MRKIFIPVLFVIVTLACSVSGLPSAGQTPVPTFDLNAPNTAIVLTAGAAQTQTALKLPTSTSTPKPTHTPSITPTFTPTFLWGLPTSTPIPTFTPLITVETPSQADESDSGGEGDEEDTQKKKNKDEDPRKLTDKPWSCVVVGTYPRRELVVNPQVKFVVEFTVFNAGTKSWGYNDLDFVWKSGFRNEGTKIQDFPSTIPSGGEVKLYATFIAPKKAGDYQSFFHLTVGKRDFCGMYYIFKVIEK